jgi:hypothetical protein
MLFVGGIVNEDGLFTGKVDGTPRRPYGMLPIVVVPEFGNNEAKLNVLIGVLLVFVSDNETLFWGILLDLEESETGYIVVFSGSS